jgi:hypothetical protein
MVASEVSSILEGTGWMGAVRDDRAVAAEVASGREMDDIYMLEGAAVFDEFLHFLSQTTLIRHFEMLARRMPCVRENVPPLQYVLLYVTKVAMGIQGMAQMGPVLLQDPAMMQLVGFNAHEIANGVTRRGDSRRAEGTEREGPVSTEAVADNLVKLSPVAMETFFNDAIRDLIPRVILTSRVNAVGDTTDLETTENYEGCGRVQRDRKVQVKDSSRLTPKVKVTVYGWKVGVLYHPATSLPLAAKITTINVSDHDFTLALVDQAIKNLGDKKLTLVSLDRGFLDGETMWTLKHDRDVDFIIPAKSNMLIYEDACSQVSVWQKSLRENPDAPGPVHLFPDERSEVKPVKGQDGQRTTRIDRTVVVGVTGLTTLDSYGTADHYKQHNSKTFEPNPINAVVVTEYHGEKQHEPAVFLTSLPVTQPFYTYDRYDDRSLIENQLFRESKQGWALQRPPKKTGAAVNVHVFMALVVMAVLRFFRIANAPAPVSPEDERPIDPAAQKEFELGIRRYRQALKVKNRNKVMVFIDNVYGIFHVQEFALLAGLKLSSKKRTVGTTDEVFLRYGLQPPMAKGP